MKRRDFLRSSFTVGAGIGLGNIPNVMADDQRQRGARPETAPERSQYQHNGSQPHIIFIMTDQHRADALGCMGNKSIYTPHLDKLAKDGTLFTSGYSSTPSSTPARAGLLTGMSPWHHGMLGYGKVAEKYEFEMPQMLRDLGYFTYGIGKMHWAPQTATHGFHGTLLDESGREESPYFKSDYRKWFMMQAAGQDPDATGIGWNDHGAGVYKLEERVHPTRWTAQMACDMIDNYNSEEPLFLKVSFARPHSPYDPPQRYLDMYKDVDIPAPAKGDWAENWNEPKQLENMATDAPFANFGDDYAINSRRHYYAAISFIDDQIGEIIASLKARGMYDNALICFTADHGDMMGDHYHWRKTYAYEGSTAVPYIVKWPESTKLSVKKGSKVENPVELRDFLPTFIDVAGGSVPERMDGKSLLALVQGKENEWREWLDLEHATCYSNHNYWCALTDGKLKYIWFMHTGDEQLFDLTKDPLEERELSKDKKYAKQLEMLRGKMVEHLSERGEGFVKDGKLVVRKKTQLYSPLYPKA